VQVARSGETWNNKAMRFLEHNIRMQLSIRIVTGECLLEWQDGDEMVDFGGSGNKGNR
jgi:hypothetical protein